jgi:hypothetical protein
MGLDPADLVVVGDPATGMDVYSHSLDHVASAPVAARRQLGSPTCPRPAGRARRRAMQ